MDLQCHHQAISNHINIGTLSGSAHIWDPKMFTEFTGSIYKIESKNVNNVDQTWYRCSYILIKMLKPRICVSIIIQSEVVCEDSEECSAEEIVSYS